MEKVNKIGTAVPAEEKDLIDNYVKFINQDSSEDQTEDELFDGRFKRESKHLGSMKKPISKQVKKNKRKIAAASRRKNR